MASHQQSLLERFGDKRGTAVHFEHRPEYGPDDLLCDSMDTLADIAIKISNAAEVVKRGGSLAVALGTIQEGEIPVDFSTLAKEGMSSQELDQYEAWEKGAKPPALDRDRDRAPVERNPSHKNRDEKRLAFFRKLYADNEMAVENLVWFQKQHPYLVPLIVAGSKVLGVERGRTNNSQRDIRLLSEQQAASKITALQAQHMGVITREINRLTAEIQQGASIVQARKVAMMPDVEGRNKPQVPANKVREAMGRPTIGAPRRWNIEGAEGRAERLMTTPRQREETQVAESSAQGAARSGGQSGPATKKRKAAKDPVGKTAMRKRPATRSTPTMRGPTGDDEDYTMSGDDGPRYTPQSPPA